MRFPCLDIADTKQARQQAILLHRLSRRFVVRIASQHGGQREGVTDGSEQISHGRPAPVPTAAFEAVFPGIAIARPRSGASFGNIIVRRNAKQFCTLRTFARRTQARRRNHGGIHGSGACVRHAGEVGARVRCSREGLFALSNIYPTARRMRALDWLPDFFRVLDKCWTSGKIFCVSFFSPLTTGEERSQPTILRIIRKV